MSIEGTVRFTCFAVLRYLRVHRQVLHRDISKGNVLYMPEGTIPAEGGSGGVPLYFIKYLLGERCVELNWDWRSLT